MLHAAAAEGQWGPDGGGDGRTENAVRSGVDDVRRGAAQVTTRMSERLCGGEMTRTVVEEGLSFQMCLMWQQKLRGMMMTRLLSRRTL